MNTKDSIFQALDSIRMNKLRAFLTLVSICIGVFAIMLSGTLVDSLNESIAGEIEASGENSFSIYRMPKFTDDWRKYRNRRPVSLSQYKALKEKMTTTELISTNGSIGSQVVQAGIYETDPEITLIGSDEYYLMMNNMMVVEGRGFAKEDIDNKRNVAIIGDEIKETVFPNMNPIGRKIRIKNHSYTVIGVLEKKGALFFQSMDNIVVIPITDFLQYVDRWWRSSLDITIKAKSSALLTPTMDEAIGIMRSLRKVKPWEENNFEIETNESLADQFSSMTSFLVIFGGVVSAFALLAAGVGIMNIMLVTVKERTREIGVRKALGAKNSWILFQFIIETITICQLGGFGGLFLGIGVSAILSPMLDITLHLSFGRIIASVIICTLLGLTFGIYPSWKAAKLNPIDALRYE